MNDPRFDDVDVAALRAAHSVKWNAHDSDVLAAWIADMDFPVAAPIQQAIDKYRNESFIGYPGKPFSERVSHAFVDWSARRYNVSIDAANVVVLTEIVQGIHATLHAFSQRGDGILLLTPLYPPFLEAVAEQSRRLVEYRLQLINDVWAIDWEALAALVRAERPRIFMLCHPHNPLGRVFTVDELQRFADLAHEVDAIVVSDEIHAELTFNPYVHVPLVSLSDEVAARTVTLHSASKAFNTAGMRCAVMSYGTASLRDRAQDALGSHHLLGVPATIGMFVTEAAWRNGSDWLADCVSYLATNATYVSDRLSAMGLIVARNQATYLQWIDFSSFPNVLARLAADPSKCVSDLLRVEAKVAFNDGPTFGAGLEHCARLNFGTSHALATELCDRVESWLSTQ